MKAADIIWTTSIATVNMQRALGVVKTADITWTISIATVNIQRALGVVKATDNLDNNHSNGEPWEE